MNASSGGVDYVARAIDNAVYIGLGAAILTFAPRLIRRQAKTGKVTEGKARLMFKVVWPLGLLLIIYGALRIFLT